MPYCRFCRALVDNSCGAQPIKHHLRYTSFVRVDNKQELHGSKVSRESDLRSVSYKRPVGVRSFVKNVKSLSENQHNS